MFETRVSVSVKQLLFALVLFGVMLAMFSIAQGQPTEASPQTDSVPVWTVYMKPYGTENTTRGYLVNVVTGETFFLSTDKKYALRDKTEKE